MVNPVPGYKITTPYRRTGPHWRACGWHTGADFAAPRGTSVVAARAGTVRHTSYGSAFGSRQFAVVCADGTEDFYAHCSSRPANGAKVKTGQRLAAVSDWGNATGPHLHFERHAKAGSWNCSNMRNPSHSINWEDPMGYRYNYSGKPSGKQNVSRSYQRLDSSLYVPPGGALLQKVYVNISDPKLRAGALMGAVRLRCTRAKNNNHTGYIDIPVHPDLAPKNGGVLTTHVVFHNNPGSVFWSFKAIGGLESAVINTRYVSRLVVLK